MVLPATNHIETFIRRLKAIGDGEKLEIRKLHAKGFKKYTPTALLMTLQGGLWVNGLWVLRLSKNSDLLSGLVV